MRRPHRIRATLEEMLAAFGDRAMALGRELTKAHEELVVRPISQHLAAINEGRGEYTLVVAPADTVDKYPDLPSATVLYQEFGQLIELERGDSACGNQTAGAQIRTWRQEGVLAYRGGPLVGWTPLTCTSPGVQQGSLDPSVTVCYCHGPRRPASTACRNSNARQRAGRQPDRQREDQARERQNPPRDRKR